MLKGKLRYIVFLTSFLLLTGCVSEGDLKSKMAKIIKENPEIVTKSIEENPAEYVEAFQKAVKEAQEVLAKRREDEEKKKLEARFDDPLKPEIRSDESVRGTKGAPLTLVEYSDFECPFCTRGYNTVQELLEKYKGKIQFIYKHLPLSFHQNALISAQYYEAIRLQDEKKAFEFHDIIFKNQRKLKNGEKYLKSIAKQVGADMGKLAKDYNSKKVLERIEADQKEAAEFGIQGTPGFLINGVPVKGAYPTSHFVDIIGELQKRGKVNL